MKERVNYEMAEAIKEKDFFFHLWLWTDTGRRLLLQDKSCGHKRSD